MKKAHLRASWFLLITVILFGAVGCNLPSAKQNSFQTSVAGTLAAENAGIPSAEPVDINLPPPEMPNPTITLSPTLTLSPTITASPTITLTSTLEAPMVSVSTSTNCRTGPGTIFDIVGALMVGELAEVVGKGEYGNYWIIKNPDGSGECWLWSNYATLTGPTDGLTVHAPPPTPTPAFDWSGAWGACYFHEGDMGCVYRSMTIETDGRDFTASVDHPDSIISYTGTISDDYMTVSGTRQDDFATGSFKLYAVGVDQFNGHEAFGDGTDNGMCGARGSAGPPSPCYRP